MTVVIFFMMVLLTAFAKKTAHTTASSSNWSLVFSDDFNGNHIDTTKWNIWNTCVDIYSNQKQCYSNSPSVIYVQNGSLIIKPKYQTTCIGGSCKNVVSGQLDSMNNFEFNRGRYEARIKLPIGKTMWPSFWLLMDENVPGVVNPYAEVDIMESYGGQMNYMSSTIWSNNGLANSAINPVAEYSETSSNAWNTSFNIFALEWNCTALTIFYNNRMVLSMNISSAPNMLNNQSAFTPGGFSKFYMLLTVAIGGDMFAPNNPTLKQIRSDSTSWTPMYVDYVRVYNDTSSIC